MALHVVKEILLKAATDPSFRMRLFTEPDAVFSRYDLSQEEKQCLRELDEEKIASVAGRLQADDISYPSDIRILM
jgi:hypothetical protein